MNHYEIRAVQLDLARQIESVDMVKRSFEVAAMSGMNTVVLYLEDRIKTPTYPYAKEEESYSIEDIQELVAFGGELGLDLIPVVSPVGHTERFLEHEELKHLAELRGKIAGMFNKDGEESYSCACPQLPEAVSFFDAYLTEIAGLFPSKYFHIGFDEVWDMGYCELCKAKKNEDLYLESVLHYRELMRGLGKEIMIWDDMMEQFPWVLEKLPRDIILCGWFYHFTEQYPESRFPSCSIHDYFGEFERLGFRYLACPWMTNSVDALTLYARKKKPMGMLLTTWNMSDYWQNPHLFPVIRYAGILWSKGELPGIGTLEKATADFTGSAQDAKALAAVMRSVLGIPYVNIPLPGEKVACRMPSEFMYTTVSSFTLLENLLEQASGDRLVLDSWLIRVRHLRISMQLWEVWYALHEYRAGVGAWSKAEIVEQSEICKQEVKRLTKELSDLHERCRGGLSVLPIQKEQSAIMSSVEYLIATAGTATVKDIGRVVVYFNTPDYTSAEKLRITLHDKNGTDYEVTYGGFKPPYMQMSKYGFSFEISACIEPKAVSLTTDRYGAAGISYIRITLPEEREYVPLGIEKVSGHVSYPEYLLTDDYRTTIFGEQDKVEYYNNHVSPKREHMVKLLLKESGRE